MIGIRYNPCQATSPSTPPEKKPLELADMSEGVDLKKLRQIARVHIEKAASGDMLAIKELGIGLEHANLVVLLFHAIHTLVDHFPEFVPKYLIC
jgi:hypothetical protein